MIEYLKGTPDPEHPNISPTWWGTMIDQKNGVYHFDSALSPQMVWLNLGAWRSLRRKSDG